MSQLVRSAAAGLSRTRRIPRCRPLSSRAEKEVNAVLDEIMHSRTLTTEMVAKTMKTCFIAKQKMIRQTVLRSWMFAATGIAGYYWGYSLVPEYSPVPENSSVPHRYCQYCGGKLTSDDEVKQRTGSSMK